MAKRRRRIRPKTEAARARRTEVLRLIRRARLKQRVRHTSKRADELTALESELNAISPYPVVTKGPAGSFKDAAAIWAELTADEESERNA